MAIDPFTTEATADALAGQCACIRHIPELDRPGTVKWGAEQFIDARIHAIEIRCLPIRLAVAGETVLHVHMGTHVWHAGMWMRSVFDRKRTGSALDAHRMGGAVSQNLDCGCPLSAIVGVTVKTMGRSAGAHAAVG
jgi:hypothetical protein